jgi:polysaccharide pyruvyl transferase WcaK-like protein
MGDSFSDLYGSFSFFKEATLKQIALFYKRKLILGPQTIGPFNKKYNKKWASAVVKKSYLVYVRDSLTEKYVAEMGSRSILTTDIAFFLPSKKVHKSLSITGKKRVGVVPSALMLNNGMSEKCSFQMKMNYREFCMMLLERLSILGYEIYLIAHVLSNNNVENDYAFCSYLKSIFPTAILAPRFTDSMHVKAYFAEMDCVIGSRMHATIGAFSMGIPIIAVSYSRKFQGLYNSLNYPYVIDAKKEGESEAVEKIIAWLNSYQDMVCFMQNSLKQAKQANNEFISSLERLFGGQND